MFPAGANPATQSADAAPAGPAGTRKLPVEEAPAPPAPTWSGSATVPPPPARNRAWGESAEPTPVPPTPATAPEDLIPVDPWAGADTGDWELPSAELPSLPPTTPYPAPAQPHSGPPAPAPHPASPPAGHPVSPSVAYPPVSPPTAYPPVSPPPAGYPARSPVSPPTGYPARSPASPPTGYPVAPPPPASPPPPPAWPKRWRRNAPPVARPVAPPPGWQAPKGYLPVPVRRRRKWPWVLLFTLACCCGCPAYWAAPMVSQYPATAVLPPEVRDLRLRQDEGSVRAAKELEAQVRSAHWLAEDTFAGIYTTRTGKRVTVFGGTGFRLSPESDADAEIARLGEQYALGEPQVFHTGVRGRHERCAVGRVAGTGVVVCTSVDHGSIATAVFTRLSMDDSAALLDHLREQIVTQQQN
ncbi:hypothetical protein QTQ03_12315 [Micromonospora sp. WMMA1363]|uniref:hypothetical protein n=1 Tax=Micromonospora sp. WMMA1363 TaxID=3053985 RepID=UPI00259CF2D1|nr:hypothetical protein [Micromonospora sp. WMMA1363]MDM4720324.1 hypothetical protein [Micromonospora sp. WMMA1363]